MIRSEPWTQQGEINKSPLPHHPLHRPYVCVISSCLWSACVQHRVGIEIHTQMKDEIYLIKLQVMPDRCHRRDLQAPSPAQVLQTRRPDWDPIVSVCVHTHTHTWFSEKFIMDFICVVLIMMILGPQPCWTTHYWKGVCVCGRVSFQLRFKVSVFVVMAAWCWTALWSGVESSAGFF